MQLLLAIEFITKMNNVQFVQQFEPMELEYRESLRLGASVTNYESYVRHSGVGVYAKLQTRMSARAPWKSSA